MHVYYFCLVNFVLQRSALTYLIHVWQEAKALWERIQSKQGLNKWRPDLEEEYEDTDGNIYNKKTYTDLQRQGLI
jgi:hypothetical protein